MFAWRCPKLGYTFKGQDTGAWRRCEEQLSHVNLRSLLRFPSLQEENWTRYSVNLENIWHIFIRTVEKKNEQQVLQTATVSSKFGSAWECSNVLPSTMWSVFQQAGTRSLGLILFYFILPSTIDLFAICYHVCSIVINRSVLLIRTIWCTWYSRF